MGPGAGAQAEAERATPRALSRTLVVDASALVDLLIGRAPAPVAEAIERSGVQLNVPALCDVEVIATLRKVVRRGLISKQRAREALDDYMALSLDRHDHLAVLRRAFDLETFSARDAVYVALAERLDAALLTTDLRLARAVASSRGLRVPLA